MPERSRESGTRLGSLSSPAVEPVINCVGYATRVGGSVPHEDVLAAMHHANTACFEIDDLEDAASQLIARITGAEAGLVTCGAAAGLTLAAAACLAGNDIAVMDRLPDTSALPRREIIYPRPGRFDYEHPLRLAGAQLVEIDYAAPDALRRVEAAITPATAAIGYCWLAADERPAIDALATLAHARGLPLIVDAAMSLPPAENLTRFIAAGADLATYSGGKHLGGPQASGVLCGRADLIRSAWLQMVDMDVRPESWSLHPWVERGWVSGPPRHGLGRSMKVGKEAILGLMAALAGYSKRDHAAELAGWRAIIDEIARGLAGAPGLRVTPLFPAPNGQPFPVAQIETTLPRINARDLQRLLRERRPKVILAEDESDAARAYVYPMCLRPEHAAAIVEAIRAAAG